MLQCQKHWADGLQAEKEADVIIWDGGNNDTPFFKPGSDSLSAHGLRAPCHAEAAEAYQCGGPQAANPMLLLLCAYTSQGKGQACDSPCCTSVALPGRFACLQSQ